MDEIGVGGDRRYLDIPKNFFKDIKFKLSVITTGEQQNKQAQLESLFNLLTLTLGNPQAMQDPTSVAIINDIIEKSGMSMSPVSLSAQQGQGGNPAAVPEAPEDKTPQELAASEQANAGA